MLGCACQLVALRRLTRRAAALKLPASFPLRSTPAAVAAGGAGGEEGGAGPSLHSLSWNDTSQWVLGRPLGLWPLLLEHALVER